MDIDIKLDTTSRAPIYQQIADQIKLLVASGQLKQGDRLPTIREMASELGINQNTVARAFHTLQQENIIVARPHAGTTIAIHADDQAISSERQKRLTELLSDDMLKALSLGYSPEEIDASFHVQLARWHEQRQLGTEEIELQQAEAPD
jgi:GntR family transcriptional regulator